MCNSAAPCLSCLVCPLWTMRTLSFLLPWGICLPPLPVTRHHSAMRQRELGQQPMGDCPAFQGLPLCTGPSPPTQLDLQSSLTGLIAWLWTLSFSLCHWGGSSCLRCLWTHRSARPPVHAVPGDALTPTTLQRCASVGLCYLCVCLFINSVRVC